MPNKSAKMVKIWFGELGGDVGVLIDTGRQVPQGRNRQEP